MSVQINARSIIIHELTTEMDHRHEDSSQKGQGCLYGLPGNKIYEAYTTIAHTLKISLDLLNL